jgi:2,5-diketo-D-gluconate reductase A
MPPIGFGTVRASQEVIENALEAGYRMLDTASYYGTERAVGGAVRAIGIPRDELFVITKLWNTEQGHHNAKEAFASSMRRLGLNYVDLYLIHWPAPDLRRYEETWATLIELADEGLVRSIGVSNFNRPYLDDIIAATRRLPAVNQIELHPGFSQQSLRAFHRSQRITTVAWSPLGTGKVLDHAVVRSIASKVSRSPAQVILRWHLQLGNAVITKSSKTERMRENLQIFDFELDSWQINELTFLPRQGRIGPDPEWFNGRKLAVPRDFET